MNRLLLLSLVAEFLVAANGSQNRATENEATQKDLQRIQGTWQLTDGQYDGKEYSLLRINETQIVFKGNRYTIPNSDVVFRRGGTFKLDATTKPRQIDFIPAEDLDAGKTFRGIYEVDGDTYKVCFAPPGKERPKEFVSQPGSGYTLHLWKREKK